MCVCAVLDEVKSLCARHELRTPWRKVADAGGQLTLVAVIIVLGDSGGALDERLVLRRARREQIRVAAGVHGDDATVGVKDGRAGAAGQEGIG